MREKNKWKRFRKWLLEVNITVLIELLLLPNINYGIKKKYSYETNKDVLKEYNQYVQEYAEEFNNIESDLDVFARLIYDCWEENEYKPVKEEPFEYERLSMYKNKYGDCANMSDDLVAKLNEINPDYNARKLEVNLISDNKAFAEEMNLDENKYLIYLQDKKILPNHMITLVDVGDDIVILDPANTATGTLKDGKVIIFDDDLEMIETPIITYLYKGAKKFINQEKDIIKSYQGTTDIETLKDQYGPEAIEKSLKKIKRLNY